MERDSEEYRDQVVYRIPQELYEMFGVKEKMDYRKKSRSLPLTTDVFDNLLDFIHFNTTTYNRTLDHSAFYNLVLNNKRAWRKNELDYIDMPRTIARDGAHTLLLSSDFIRPNAYFDTNDYFDEEKPKNTQALAVCGFNQINAIERTNGRVGEEGVTFDINQLQTANFDNMPDMFHYLGFIKYKKLFTHIIEQAAWRLRNKKGLPITHVSIKKIWETDERTARFHIKNMSVKDVLEFGGIDVKKNALTEMEIEDALATFYGREVEVIQQKRAELAHTLGYTTPLFTRRNYRGVLDESYGKPLSQVKPDRKLQKFFSWLSR